MKFICILILLTNCSKASKINKETKLNKHNLESKRYISSAVYLTKKDELSLTNNDIKSHFNSENYQDSKFEESKVDLLTTFKYDIVGNYPKFAIKLEDDSSLTEKDNGDANSHSEFVKMKRKFDPRIYLDNIFLQVGLSYKDQIALAFLVPPIITLFKNREKAIPLFIPPSIEVLILKIALEKVFTYKEEPNFTLLYLLSLTIPLLYMNNHPSMSKLPEDVKNIILDNIKAIHYYFSDQNFTEGREALGRIIKYREELNKDNRYNKDARKFILDISSEQIENILCRSDMISYSVKVFNGIVYFFPKIFIKSR